MRGFCQHCGKELNGDEPFCPECGRPTGFQTPTYTPAPRRKNNGTVIAIVVVAVIAVFCILGIAFLPSLFTSPPTYEVTVSVESTSVHLDDLTQWEGNSTTGKIILEFYYKDADGSHNQEILLKDDYVVNTGEAITTPVTFTFKVRGELKDIQYTAFLLYGVKCLGYYPGTYDYVNDYIDIYSVDTSKITGTSRYFGDTGVAFDVKDYSGNSTEAYTGDCDPVGNITMRFTAVKL